MNAAMKTNMWIKICGITNTDDAKMVSESGADAIGLNFYAQSKRFVVTGIARDIRDQLDDRIELVGVFVNSTPQEVAAITEIVSLDTVQFHGEESADTIADFQKLAGDVNIIRAFRVGPDGFAAVDRALQELANAGITLRAVLLDAYKPGEYGGTGHQIAPELVRDWIKNSTATLPPVILAGGLNPENVKDAVSIARTWGIDTASGVEMEPGRKCSQKTPFFVSRARSAGD